MSRAACVCAAALAIMAAGCLGPSPKVETLAPVNPAPPAVGPPLHQELVSYVGRIRGGIGNYTAKTTVMDAQRSLSLRQDGGLLPAKGIGQVYVRCSRQPLASAFFRLTTWAKGEGPPTLRTTVVRVHGVTSLAGLAARFTVPKAEATDQTEYRWSVADGGGEAFQFSAAVTALVTVTASRCDVLAEATVVTTGAFDRYAP